MYSDDLHNYAQPNKVNILEEEQADAIPLPPETPSKELLAKKSKIHVQQEAVTNQDLMNAITALTKTCESTANSLASLASKFIAQNTIVEKLSSSLESLGSEYGNAFQKVDLLKKERTALRKENTSLKSRCSDMERYRKRWNLRIAGIPKVDVEDIKKKVIDLCSEISPDIAGKLNVSVALYTD
ncbi:hypothetical protein EOD39_13379 [Acipenser ruthenus]|uniref:Uncharacterized protein n=1 Tax=Acipenser ruthenus TaxID=7906 RepID=A0A662YNQ2_ACIRT|nr:hypothetical protein EOD39_13379 [Acipenser ruthenus]